MSLLVQMALVPFSSYRDLYKVFSGALTLYLVFSVHASTGCMTTKACKNWEAIALGTNGVLSS